MTELIGEELELDDLTYSQCDDSEMEKNLVETGFSTEAASQLVETYNFLGSDRFKYQISRGDEDEIEFTFKEFIHENMIPIWQQISKRAA